MEMKDKARRPPSLPPSCRVFADYSSFYVLREAPMTAALSIGFQKGKILPFFRLTIEAKSA
jgi:hypothetical protein